MLAFPMQILAVKRAHLRLALLQAIEQCERLRARREPQMRAFYGQDLHWKRQHRGLINNLQTDSAAREAVLSAFERGDYFAVKGDIELPSSGVLSAELMTRFGDINGRYARKRQLIKRAKKLIDRVGLRLPAPVKAQLRRIF